MLQLVQQGSSVVGGAWINADGEKEIFVAKVT